MWSDIKKSAKALSLDTIIPTPSGYKTMQEICVGDFVFDISGNPVRVEAVTEIMQDHTCYRVSFSNGEKVISDAGHLWYLSDRRSKGKNGGNHWGNAGIKTTEEISQNFLVQNYVNGRGYRVRCRRYSLPVTGGIGGDNIDLPIHPYVLGYWLGDGHSAAATITTADMDVIEHIKSLGYPVIKKSAHYAWSLSDGTRGGNKEKKEKTVGGKLNKLDVLNNKHIPSIYLRASRAQRLELLCGLMDSDGTVSEKGKCSFLSTNERLARDTSELLSSLGIKNRVMINDAKLNGKFISKAYRISFQAHSDFSIFKIKRKAEKLLPRSIQPSRSDRVVIEDVERAESVPVKCIQVEGGSYMITRSFIPTHNSTIAAAVVSYIANTHEYAENYIIANDLKQADSRVAHYFRRSLDLNPDFRGQYRNRGYRTTFNNHSFVEAIPIDPSGEAGSNADLIVTSELWGAHEDAKQRMWSEMTLSPTKFGKSMRWVESYAGYTGQSELLWSLYETGVKNGEPAFPDTDIEAYINKDARMFCLWNTKPRLPWQTPEYYASEMAVITSEQEFNRIHRNQWASPQEVFIPAEWWDACFDPKMPELKQSHGRPNTPIVLALDAGVSDDNFGIVGVSRHPDLPEDTCQRLARRWTPPKGGKIDFVGTEENPGPEIYVERLCQQYNIVEITYDPYQLEDFAGRMRRKGIAWFKPFDQGAKRAIADSAYRSRIRDRRIHHSGDPILREHVLNADAKKDTSGEKQIRLVKRAENMKIDLAVAHSMADYEAMRLNL